MCWSCAYFSAALSSMQVNSGLPVEFRGLLKNQSSLTPLILIESDPFDL
jgi:hypothetical protein